MRFSKKKLLLACARVLPALAAVVPPEGGRPDVARPEGNQLLELDFQEDYAQATFHVPCAGCLGTSHDDESITLSVKAHVNEKPCGVSNVTLNGAYLPQEWSGDFASGSGFYGGVTDIQENAWFAQHDLDLEWESACLHGERGADDAAQVLTVNIKSIDGKALVAPSGFTVSFKQVSPPEILRLDPTPNRSASKKDHAESWREPPPHLRLRLIVPKKDDGLEAIDSPDQPQLEDDVRELKALQAEVQKLQNTLAEKQKAIDSRVKQQDQGFKEELQQCDNITCIVKTLANGAHGAWRILGVRLRPNRQHRINALPSPPMGRPEDESYHRVWRTGNHKQGNIRIESDILPPASPHQDGSDHAPPRPPPPQQGSPRMPPPNSPFVIAIEVVLGLLCCSCIVTVIRQRCSSIRTRTERAASREERRTQRAYRCAARRHAWRKWWHGNWRDAERTASYEEKRSLIQHQEGILEDAMQEEIRQLRAAHGVIHDLVSQAEEGRVHRAAAGVYYPHGDNNAGYNYNTYCHYSSHGGPRPQTPSSPLSTTSTYPPTSLPELPSRPLSRTDSLPGYRSDASSSPPAYETDEDGDGDVSHIVANGFRRYSSAAVSTASTSGARSRSSSQWTTPESSVVDVSPRPSADTLRFVEGVECDD